MPPRPKRELRSPSVLACNFEVWWLEEPEQSLELAIQCATKAVQMNTSVCKAQSIFVGVHVPLQASTRPSDPSITTGVGAC